MCPCHCHSSAFNYPEFCPKNETCKYKCTCSNCHKQKHFLKSSQPAIDSNHNKIHDAAGQFKTAIENMGMTNVTVLYVYTQNKTELHDGYSSSGTIQAVGACEYIKNSILNDPKI